jgi:AcrR family transcriptional regulator
MARRVGVTLRAVVEATAEIADTRGLEAVTLAAVAARLGIRSPSLYAHVRGLEGLRRQLALHAASALGLALRQAAGGRTGHEALRRIASAYRRFARDHPGLYAAAQRAVKPGQDDELYHALSSAVTPVFDALAEAGVKPEERVHTARAIRSALHGFVALERLGGFGMPESVEESFERMVELLLAGVGQSLPTPGPPQQRGRPGR